MTHKGTIQLETERLILRRFTKEDAEPMFRNWASDEEVCRYVTWQCHADVGVTQELMETWSDYSDLKQYKWAIVLKENGPEPMGDISVCRQNEAVECMEMGYCMSRSIWGKGIMTEALAAVMDYLFREVGVNRIQARHDTENPASGRVMAKCGMTKEGVLRQSEVANRGRIDIAMYSILKEEYPL